MLHRTELTEEGLTERKKRGKICRRDTVIHPAISSLALFLKGRCGLASCSAVERKNWAKVNVLSEGHW